MYAQRIWWIQSIWSQTPLDDASEVDDALKLTSVTIIYDLTPVGVLFREEAPTLAHSEFCRLYVALEIACNKGLSPAGFGS